MKFLVELFLQDGVDTNVYDTLINAAEISDNVSGPKDEIRHLAHLVVTLPEFHLA